MEACLSIPDVYGEVSRHEAITIKAQDRNGDGGGDEHEEPDPDHHLECPLEGRPLTDKENKGQPEEEQG